MESTPPSISSANKPKLNVSLDLRWVALLLLAIIIAMLLIWKPWEQTSAANARTVTVTGDTTVKAVPDEYVFYPMYQITNADKAAAIKEAAAKSTELVSRLKALGVADKQIKTSVDGYENIQPQYYGDNTLMPAPLPTPAPGPKDYVYNVRLIVTVTDKPMAQKVQNYLETTEPTGSVTPQPTFSQTLRKRLEAKARDAATRDARSKADQSASNLGFRVGNVKSVNDGSGFGGDNRIMGGVDLNLSEKSAPAPSLSIQPGENELSYSVTVVYYIK